MPGPGDENQLVELADGRLLMDIRQESGPHRSFSTSEDGGKTWSARRPGLPVSPVACAIERYTLKSAGDDRDRIIWTGPKGPDRQNLVVRISYDEGQTFPVERLIAAGPAAYSDLTILKDKTIGVLWERGAPRLPVHHLHPPDPGVPRAGTRIRTRRGPVALTMNIALPESMKHFVQERSPKADTAA